MCGACMTATWRKPVGEVAQAEVEYVCAGCSALARLRDIDQAPVKTIDEREAALREREKELDAREESIRVREAAIRSLEEEKRVEKERLYSAMVAAKQVVERDHPVVGSSRFTSQTSLTRRQKNAIKGPEKERPGMVTVREVAGHLRAKGLGVVRDTRRNIVPTKCIREGEKITFVGDSQTRELGVFAAFRGCASTEVTLSGYRARQIADTVWGRNDMTEGAAKVCVLAGSNDDIGEPSRMVRDVMALAEELRAENRKVLVTPVPLQNAWRNSIAKKHAWSTVNRELVQRCGKAEGIEFLDIPDIMAGRSNVMKADGVHLNHLGKKLVVEACLRPFLA